MEAVEQAAIRQQQTTGGSQTEQTITSFRFLLCIRCCFLLYVRDWSDRQTCRFLCIDPHSLQVRAYSFPYTIFFPGEFTNFRVIAIEGE